MVRLFRILRTGTVDTVEAVVTAASVNGKKATCKVTVIVNVDASDEGNPYAYTLDKKAVSFDVKRNDQTVSVTPESVGADIATLAGISWSNSTLKEKWNEHLFRICLADWYW